MRRRRAVVLPVIVRNLTRRGRRRIAPGRMPAPGALTLIAAIGVLLLTPATAQAYIGPGAGLSAFGALLALVATTFVAILGFVWFPIKRLLRGRQKAADRRDGNSEQSEI